jgi:tripartite ATP-independent transporter DctP family solute receptor
LIRHGVALLTMLVLSTAGADAREFSFADIQAVDYPTVRAVRHMSDLLEKRTGGRLKISRLGHSDPDTETFTLAQLRSGTLDVARMTLTPFHDRVALSTVPSLPFLFGSAVHSRAVLDGPVGETILRALDDQGVIGLCFYDGGARSFYGSKPFRRPADMAGLTVRVQPAQIWTEMAAVLGAKPMALPFNRVQAALASRLVDAAENHVSLYWSAKHYESARVFSTTDHTWAPTVLLFSKTVWLTLSEEDRASVREAARGSVPYMRTAWDEHEAAAQTALAAAGVTFVNDVDRQAFKDLMRPIYSRYATSPSMQKLVEQIDAAR